MTIYTSYYAGIIKGEAVSISLYPPSCFQGRHLPLFAPTPELLKWWKSSVKDTAAQQEYKRQFREILGSRQQLIDLWVRKQQQSSADITLCCFEKSGDFCHRYIVGREVIGRCLPDLWGGEVGLLVGQASTNGTQNQSETTPVELSRGNGLTDTPSNSDTGTEESYNSTTTESIKVQDNPVPAINFLFPPVIQQLLSKCYDSDQKVKCDRVECGYYLLSLGEEDLGVWSELGVLGVLSGLTQPYKSDCLIVDSNNQQ